MSSPEEESGTPPPSTAEGDTLSPTNELEEVVPPPADETDVASDPEDIEENDDTEAESVVAGEDVNMEDTYEAEAKDPIEDLGDKSAEAHRRTSVAGRYFSSKAITPGVCAMSPHLGY